MRRDWCCDTPIDEPHSFGCPFSPDAGDIDYMGPATMGRAPIYLGDGAYAAMGNWVGQTCVYASNGISRTNRVYLEVDMIDKLHAWVHQND